MATDAEGPAAMETDSSQIMKLVADSASMQGRHPKQEDRHVKIPDLSKAAKALKMPLDHLDQPCALFCVYDGHQGPLCSEFVAKSFHLKLLKRLSAVKDGAHWTDERVQAALGEVFEELDGEFMAKHRTALDGCTAVVSLVIGARLFVAWVGNCRCLLGKCTGPEGIATVATTEDHRPMIEEEGERVKKAGGVVVDCGFGYMRVAHEGYEERMRELRRAQASGMGDLGKVPVALDVTRALGDRAFKAASGKALLIPTPGVKTIRLDTSCKLMALLAGGVPNMMMDEEVVNELDLVRDPADLAADVRAGCGALVQECYKRGGEDNLTVILVRMQWSGEVDRTYVRKVAAVEKAKAAAAAAAAEAAPKESAAAASKRRRLEAAASVKAQRVAAYEKSGGAASAAASEARKDAEVAKMRVEVENEKAVIARKEEDEARKKKEEDEGDITGDEKEEEEEEKPDDPADVFFAAHHAKKRVAGAANGQAEEPKGLDAAEAFFAARKAKKAEETAKSGAEAAEPKGLDAADAFFAARKAKKAEETAKSGAEAAAKKVEEAAKQAEMAAKKAEQEALAKAKAAEAAAAAKAKEEAEEAKTNDISGGDELTFL